MITNPVNINGLSQPDSSATIPLIQIDGTNAGAGASGLEIASSASGTATKPTQVSGLELTDFGDGGVTVEYASYVNLNDLFVGVTKQGASFLDEGNGSYGVLLAGGSHDTLSGSVVSANQGTGVDVGAASYDTLTGDFIGTDVTGELALDQNGHTLGNNGNGVTIYAGATYTTVTKTVIGNNNGQGVELSDEGTSHNALSLDEIGADLLGSHALPNQQDGVLITSSASYNTVGGTTSSFNDLISGNASAGVALSNGANFNAILGDFIGVTSNGASALGNGASGVNVSGGCAHNTIGGTAAGSRDVISASFTYGVYLGDSGTIANVVEGDFIGTDVDRHAGAAESFRGAHSEYRHEQHDRRHDHRRPRSHRGQHRGWRRHPRQWNQRERGRGGLHPGQPA